ncbi:dihydrodipicolinate synthase family protein [Streptomyces cinerochromogenes]|uniref:dihydrodipicolinate synthase family protein n=1 Tax=Streptomyces cinerochromogenes TaxID=66422 RepID=UPI00166FB303|nr:dihydrodipicolinate synthase family protein [Streptomyces cinerochromogenes]GGT02356.1 dihydrodipicolinate synthase family protein [Streptomyces cinerochromogenes]
MTNAETPRRSPARPSSGVALETGAARPASGPDSTRPHTGGAPLSGVVVPLVTPLDRQGRVRADDVARLVDSVRAGVTALMPTLSSGEGWLLTEAQWRDMVAATVHCADGLPVIAGVQLPDTAAVVARTRLAAELGADAVAVTTPFGAGVGQEDIVTHYERVLGAGSPVLVYNEEALSGNRIEAGTLARVCRLPGVIGVKESSGDPAFTRQLVAAGLGVPVFEGWENLLLQVPGVAGFIGPLANLEPALCAALLRHPTPELQAEVDTACETYGILRDDWYLHVKRALVARGVIGTDTTAQDVRAAAAAAEAAP